MESLVRRIVNFLLKREYIENEEEEFYIFAIESIFITLINYITIIVMALILGKVIECVVFVCLIKMLRGNMGGFHMGKWYECYIVSNVMMVICLILCDLLKIKLLIIACLMICGVILVIRLAPCVHPNNPIEDIKVKNYRKKSIVNIVLVGVSSIVLKYGGYDRYVNLCVMATCVSVMLLCVGKICYENNPKTMKKDG